MNVMFLAIIPAQIRLLAYGSMTAHWDSYKGQLWQGSYSN